MMIGTQRQEESDDGKVKVKGKFGWEDKKGKVWVPTGEGNPEKPHWDV